MPREYRGEYTRQKAETLTQLNRNILVRWSERMHSAHPRLHTARPGEAAPDPASTGPWCQWASYGVLRILPFLLHQRDR